MSRQDKYPDTKYFHFYNANPKNRITGDCAIRALCTGLDVPYNDVVMDLAKMQCETGYAADQLIERYLKSKGHDKFKEPRTVNNKKISVAEFCEINGAQRVIAIAGSHHIIAIINNIVYDIWDSSKSTMHTYWIVG